MSDKRDIRRVKQRAKIHFGIDDFSRLAFTEDISMRGMFIRTANITPVNSMIKVRLTLPDGTVVELEGRVAWARKVPPNLFHLAKKCGMGIRFLRFTSGEDAFNSFFATIAKNR